VTSRHVAINRSIFCTVMMRYVLEFPPVCFSEIRAPAATASIPSNSSSARLLQTEFAGWAECLGNRGIWWGRFMLGREYKVRYSRTLKISVSLLDHCGFGVSSSKHMPLPFEKSSCPLLCSAAISIATQPDKVGSRRITPARASTSRPYPGYPMPRR